MDTAQVVDISRDAIIVMIRLAAPVMMVGLGVGLIVALFQALTQIQEMTLAFVPKILAIFVASLLLMPFMIQTMSDFMQQLIDMIIGLGIE